MDHALKKLSMFTLVVLIIAGVGVGAAFGGYFYGRDKAREDTENKLKAEFEVEKNEIKSQNEKDQADITKQIEEIKKALTQIEKNTSKTSTSSSSNSNGD